MPGVIPVTMPVEETVAALLLAVHVPPVAVSDNAIVAPVYTDDAPVIVPADGVEFTVTDFVAVELPHPFVVL